MLEENLKKNNSTHIYSSSLFYFCLCQTNEKWRENCSSRISTAMMKSDGLE